MSFSFVHAADLHLDTPFAGLTQLPPSLREAVKESTFQAFDRLIELCINKRADFLLLCGDIYDSSERSLRAQLHFQRGMERLAHHGIHVFVIHGNHDPLDGYRARLRWPETVHFFGGDEVEAVPFLKNGREVARIYGISYRTSRVWDNLSLRFRKERDAPYAIGMLHANVGSLSAHDNYAPCSIQDLQQAHMDYWALGHIHTRQVLKDNVPWIVYPGNIQGRSIKETGEKGCYHVSVNDQGEASLSFEGLESMRWSHLSIDASSCVDEQGLIDILEEKVGQAYQDTGGRSLLLRIELFVSEALTPSFRKAAFTDDLLDQIQRHEAPFIWIESLSCRFSRSSDEEDPFLQEMQSWIAAFKENPYALQEVLAEAWKPLVDDHRLGSKWLSDLEKRQVKWEEELEKILFSRLKEG